MIFAFTAAMALGPSLLLVWYFHSRDANPEPARVVWVTFFLGVAIVVPVLIVDQPLALVVARFHGPYAHGLADAFFTAGVPEELFKFLVVTLYCARHREFDEPMDGVVYGAVASLGFATIENVLYVAELGTGVALVRACTAVPGHAFMGAIMGYLVGQARFREEGKGRLLALAYVVPVALHTLYDFPVLAQKGDLPDGEAAAPALLLLTVAVLVGEWAWVARRVRRLRADQEAAQRAAAVSLAGLFPDARADDVPLAPGAAGAASREVAAAARGVVTVGPGAADGFYALAASGGVALAPAPPVAAGRARRPVRGWSLALVGGLLVTGGFFVTIAVLFALPSEADRASLLLGGALLGFAPMALGAFLFARGLIDLAPRR